MPIRVLLLVKPRSAATGNGLEGGIFESPQLQSFAHPFPAATFAGHWVDLSRRLELASLMTSAWVPEATATTAKSRPEE
ncbi:MAG: hypothetical protein ACRDTD_24565 [Pseudonocardiaceae bacterium]